MKVAIVLGLLFLSLGVPSAAAWVAPCPGYGYCAGAGGSLHYEQMCVRAAAKADPRDVYHDNTLCTISPACPDRNVVCVIPHFGDTD